MQILVVADSRHNRLADLIFDQFAGVAMGDTRGEFLHADVSDCLEQVERRGHLTTTHLLHSTAFKSNWVKCTRHCQIITNDN